MAEEERIGASDEDVEAEIRRIEDEIDAEPGIIDMDRVGKAMVILGTISFVSYMALFFISMLVQAEESWGMFNMWSTGQFLAVSIGSLTMIIIGYFISVRYGGQGESKSPGL